MRLSIYFFLIMLGVYQSICATAQKQPADPYYKHFTGMLDTNMYISIDLQSTDGKLNGQYNYAFKIQGSEDSFFYGKTIPVQGLTTDEGRLIFHDYTSEASEFSCRFKGPNRLEGTWQGGNPPKVIPFVFNEDYSNGSQPFEYYSADRKKFLLEGEDFKGISPAAEISIRLLYPGKSYPARLRDTLNNLITKFWINNNRLLKSPDLFLENIVYDFFDSYVRITSGIENVTSVASFNWEKKLGMDILFNQYNIQSIKLTKYAYTGGAHGISISQHYVLSTEREKQLTLSDFLKPGGKEQLTDLLDKKLRKLNGLNPDQNLREAGFFVDKLEPNENFYINIYGIGFFYNTYEIAPYASGTTEIFVPFSEMKDLLRTGHPFQWLN